MSKEATMSGAIDDALKSLAPAASTDTPADPPADEPVVDTAATDEPAGDPPAGDDPAGDDATDDAAPADGDPEAAAADPAAAAAAAAAKPEVAADPNKKPDHVNDPIPKELKEATQERIRSLASTVKELQPVAETGRLLLNALEDARMSPEELDMAIGYSKLIKSDNIEDKRKGFHILMNELKALAPLIGESLPGADPVAAHADLVQEVKDGKLTAERATEIAVQRNRQKAGAAAQQQHDSRAKADQQFDQALTSAKAELNALGVELAQKDPHFQAKYDAIVPALRNAFQNIHPSRWKTVFLNTYNNWKMPAAAVAAPAAAAAPPSPTPLRANKQPAGNGVKTPTTMAEAMEAGIAQARRG